MNFYKHHLGDYAIATSHLTWDEDMAYTRLIRVYYQSERPIPRDQAYRLSRATTPVQRRAVDTVLAEFFTLEDDGYHQKRCDQELGQATIKAAKNREVGNLGGRPKKTIMVSENNHDGSFLKPFDNPSQTPASREEPKPSVVSDAADPDVGRIENEEPGPGIPNCPQQKLLALYAELLPTLTQPRIWDGARASAMRARWRQCAVPSAASKGYATEEDGLRYWRKFFAYVATAPKLTSGIPYPNGTVWTPDLEWLMKASNFAKVIEGKYHQEAA